MRLRPVFALGICAILVIVLVSHTMRRRAADAQLAKENAMRSELTLMRDAIRAYHAKHSAGPRSLTDLVRDGELASIPPDPVTLSTTTWQPTLEQAVRTDDFSSTAPAAGVNTIIDVHSGAPGRDSARRPWSNY